MLKFISKFILYTYNTIKKRTGNRFQIIRINTEFYVKYLYPFFETLLQSGVLEKSGHDRAICWMQEELSWPI